MTHVTSVGIHQVNNMHLANLGHDNTGGRHAGMHAYVGGAGGKGDGGHGDHILQVEDIDEGIRHVVALLPKRVAASDYKIVLGVHIINSGGMSIPDLEDLEIDRVDDVHRTTGRCGTDIAAAPPHDFILVFRRHLERR